MSTTIQTLTVLESNKLLDVLLCDYGTPAKRRKGIRNYTIGLLMLDAGLRVGEVVSLQKIELLPQNEPTQSLVIQSEKTKNGCERIIPISKRLRLAIEKLNIHWWTLYNIQPDQPAFTAASRLRAMSVRQVENIIKSGGRKAFGKEIHPHMLRHTFATNLMRTCNIRIVQELLGHKSLTSTQVYTHPNSLDLKKAIDSIESIPPPSGL